MIVLFLATSAFAQDPPAIDVPKLDAQLYRAPIDAKTQLWAEDSSFDTSGKGVLVARLVAGYMHKPFVYEDSSGERYGLIDDAFGFNLIGGYGRGRVRAALDLPVYGLATGVWGSGAGLGDLAVDVKGTALDREESAIGLAFSARLTLPTGTTAVPLDADGVRGEVTAILDKPIGDFLVAANIGFRAVPTNELSNVVVDDVVVYRVGGSYAWTDNAGLSADLAGQISVKSPTGANLPLEALVGGWGRVGGPWVLRGGVGTGLTPGIGAPIFRGVASIAFQPVQVRDTDLDGIVDKLDSCPLDPEDGDNFEDVDGCPDLDNDKDGLADPIDRCRDDAEDNDGWQDDDGCPDPGTQVHILINDIQTGKPVEGFNSRFEGNGVSQDGNAEYSMELEPGTYAVSGALDGWVPLAAQIDVVEGPPMLVQLSVQRDVAPGILRVRVTSPSGDMIGNATYTLNDTAVETFNTEGIAEKNLVPGGYVLMVRAPGYVPASFPTTVKEGATSSFNVVLQPSKVAVLKDRLELSDKVSFEAGNATIKPESFVVLDEITGILLDRPDIVLLRIEGHTDERGNVDDNLKLSQARADAIRTYFVASGVEPERLKSLGFGESRPATTDMSAAATDKNRRVDFFIERWAEFPVPR